MSFLQNSDAVNVEEHNNTLGTKKVTIYGGNGTGSAVAVNFGGFNLPVYDYLSLNSSGSTQDIYTFYTGGSGGTLVATLTINYVDSTKAVITNVTKT